MRVLDDPKAQAAAAIIFDVQGTLIDCVGHQLQSWQDTLNTHGHAFSRSELQRYSGMDRHDMVDHLLPRASDLEKTQILHAQGRCYREKYLERALPFPHIRDLFMRLRALGVRLGIGTSCQKDELDRYENKLNVLSVVDSIACGSDVAKGKPHPDLFQAALAGIGVRNPELSFTVGDAPYDALAAKQLGLRAIGVLTGGFTQRELEAAGCEHVFSSVAELDSTWAQLVRRGTT